MEPAIESPIHFPFDISPMTLPFEISPDKFESNLLTPAIKCPLPLKKRDEFTHNDSQDLPANESFSNFNNGIYMQNLFKLATVAANISSQSSNRIFNFQGYNEVFDKFYPENLTSDTTTGMNRNKKYKLVTESQVICENSSSIGSTATSSSNSSFSQTAKDAMSSSISSQNSVTSEMPKKPKK